MKRILFLCTVLLALSAPAAFAEGINLSWDDCGSFGTFKRTFDCNTNIGTNTMVGSFVAPAGLTQYESCEAEIEIQTVSATLPEWWKFRTAGTCRQTALSSSGDFSAGPFNCTDFFAGRAAGGIGAYDIGYGGLNRSHIKLVFAVAPANAGPLIEGEEYYAFKVSISNIKSTGTGSCAGCTTPGCIFLRYIKLVQPSALADNREIRNWANRAFITWQAVTNDCRFTSARRSTWGAVKSLYR